MTRDEALPERPRSHVIGDIALRAFQYRCKPEWAFNESRADYGWDLIITIGQDGKVRDQFFAQLKGTDSANYLQDGTAISLTLQISTINFLLSQPMPTLLAVCDTCKPEEPVFFVWLKDAIALVEDTNQRWRTQQTLNLHVPVNNELTRESSDQIAEEVRKYYLGQKIKQIIGEILEPAVYIHQDTDIHSDPQVLVYKGMSNLQDAGIVDIFENEGAERIEALSPKDQERYRKLKESSMALTELRDNDADQLLAILKDEIEDAADGIKAKFYNNNGILSLHRSDFPSAIQSFTNASMFRPNEVKYTTNLLLSEFFSAKYEQKKEMRSPPGWIDRLNNVLSVNPDYCQAVRVKASWIAQFQTVSEAESYLRSSSCWETDRLNCIFWLAEIYHSMGNLERAKQLFREAEGAGLVFDPVHHATFGSVLLISALGFEGGDKEFFTYGTGPSNLNVPELRTATEYLKKGFLGFKSRGFPPLSIEGLINYFNALILLGEQEEAEHVIRALFERDPENPQVNSAYAMCLVRSDKSQKAIKYAEFAYSHLATPTHFRNLCLCYLQADYHDELISHILSRGESGYYDAEEETFSKSLLAIGYNEIGEIDKARNIIKNLKSDPLGRIEAVLAEVAIARANNASAEEILEIYRNAKPYFEEDQKTLTGYLYALLPLRDETANEIIDCIKKIVSHRQIMSHEAELMAHAYLHIQDPSSADQLLESAIIRFPKEPKLLYARAIAKMDLGDEEGSFKLFEEYASHDCLTYPVLSNLGVLAFETGRVEESIKFLEKSLKKAKDKRQRGVIHWQLFELKRTKGENPKSLLRHAHEYGRTVENVEEEARYLIMLLFSPPLDTLDEEAESWVSEGKKRLADFSEQHPNFPALKMFKLPEDDAQGASEFLAQLYSMMLPGYLASVPLRMSARAIPYPLAFRAKYFPNTHSIFAYWTTCTASSDYENSIHISDGNIISLNREKEAATLSDQVCVDLTTLLTLAEFDMLDALPENFARIVISRGTKRALQRNVYHDVIKHPLAEKIENWRIANRKIVRVRSLDGHERTREEADPYEKNACGIFVLRKEVLSEALPNGSGEIFLLAKEMKLPLYSDDLGLRQIASVEHAIPTFSTISLLSVLKERAYISLKQEGKLLSEMIHKNFNVVIFEPDHLMVHLHRVVVELGGKNLSIFSSLLQKDPVLGTFIRQFAEKSLNIGYRVHLFVEWWKRILADAKLHSEVLIECMSYSITFMAVLTLGYAGAKQAGKDQSKKQVAELLAYFLWSTYLTNFDLTVDAWQAIKTCAERTFEEDAESVLFDILPVYLIEAARNDQSVKKDKLSLVVQLAQNFDSKDRERFDQTAAKYIHRLK